MRQAIAFQHPAKKRGGGRGIASRPVPVLDHDTEMTAQVAQAIRREARKYFPGQPHGAELVAIELMAGLRKVVLQKGIIEINVVGDENGPFQHGGDAGGQLLEKRGILHHGRGDTGKHLDIIRDFTDRFYETFEPAYHFATVMQHNSHLRYVVISRITSRSFYIHDGIHAVKLHNSTGAEYPVITFFITIYLLY